MRVNATVKAVLQAIDAGHNWGLAIVGATGLPQRTVYEALRRLRENGWVTRELEDTRTALSQNRSERHLHHLTDKAEAERRVWDS